MEPPRETISLLLTSILGGLALTNSIVQIQTAMAVPNADKIQIPLHSVLFFLVFVSVWFRFIPGNISHIRGLERWASTSVNTWLFDVSIITAESMIIVFMADPSVNNPELFLWALLALLLLDVGWLAGMLPGVKSKTRPEPQWTWLWLNIPSISIVVAFLILSYRYPDIVGLTSMPTLLIIAIVFVLSAFIDVYRSAPDWFGRPKHDEPTDVEKKAYQKYMAEAINEAKKSLSNEGIPIGAILVENGNIVGRGHNRRVQDQDPMAHAEIECLRNAGRRQTYRGTTLFSTLMPCCLCAGAIIQFGVRKVVVGENRNFTGARSFLDDCGVKVVNLDMKECHEMLRKYIKTNPATWNEDIGKL